MATEIEAKIRAELLMPKAKPGEEADAPKSPKDTKAIKEVKQAKA
jgi:recombination protein RecA